jgi:MFS family permease
MLNAVSYLVPTTILLSLGAGRSDRTRVTPGERVTVRQVISRLRRGRQLPAVIAVATAAALAGTSLPTLLLLFVHQEHATSAAVYGLLLGTMSAGSLAAAVLTWRWTSSPRSVHIEALLLGVLILAVAAVPGVRGAVPLLFVVGFLFLTLRVGVMTLVQLQAPAHGRATTVALLSLVLAGAQIVGTTSFSALASVVGARRTIALVGLLLVIAVVAISVATGLSRQGGSVKAPPDAPKSSTQALIRPGVQQGAGQRRCVQDKLYDRQSDVR